MRDWLGKTWDFLVESVGGLIARQRWVDYKKWTDFPDGRWVSPEMMRTIESERYENPPYKFFWWYLRFGNFIGKILEVLKVSIMGKISVYYFLRSLASLRQRGICLLKVNYKLQVFNFLKVLGQGLGSLRFWLIPKGVLKVLGQGLAIIRLPLQILGVIKVLGFCNVIVRFFIQASGNVKVQGNACVTEYVSWQHFGTWQDWANATGGKWYYKC